MPRHARHGFNIVDIISVIIVFTGDSADASVAAVVVHSHCHPRALAQLDPIFRYTFLTLTVRVVFQKNDFAHQRLYQRSTVTCLLRLRPYCDMFGVLRPLYRSHFPVVFRFAHDLTTLGGKDRCYSIAASDCEQLIIERPCNWIAIGG